MKDGSDAISDWLPFCMLVAVMGADICGVLGDSKHRVMAGVLVSVIDGTKEAERKLDRLYEAAYLRMIRTQSRIQESHKVRQRKKHQGTNG